MSGILSNVLLEALAEDEARLLVVCGGLTTGPANQAFQQRPSQVVSVGRGEQNAVLVSSGLLREGRTPIIVMSGAQLTGRAYALFGAFAEIGELDLLMIVVGPTPPGVATPASGRVVQATNEDDAVAQFGELLQASGSRVLLVT